MLTKALLTGVVLAGLSGSIVYFGTEGAGAMDRGLRTDLRVEETELAGAAIAEINDDSVIKTPTQAGSKLTPKERKKARAEAKAKAKAERAEAKAAEERERAQAAMVDAQATEANVENTREISKEVERPAEKTETKPKRKWLDQYLKSRKSKKDETPSEPSEIVETEVEIEQDPETNVVTKTVTETITRIDGLQTTGKDEPKSLEKIKIRVDGAAASEGFDLDMIEDLIRDHKNSDTKIRVLVSDGEASMSGLGSPKSKMPFDYNPVLAEAKKLQVIEMRNIAMFEIIDYAIDRGDFGQAADMLQELSEPELRDTARAKIGVGLAGRGDSEAAFSVLEEMEIDQLTASVRLEIITALMATKAERSAPPVLR